MRAYITFGLGFGDEGKGATVDYLCRHHKAKLVVRYSGGCQAGHNVVLPNGHRHCFSQWGAGTFAGACTYLAQPMIIDPLAMRNEAKALQDAGIVDPWSLLTVHPKCLVSTRYHKQINRTDPENLAHGTCGMGIGATRKYWIDHGEDAIFAVDLWNDQVLAAKLSLLSERSCIIDPSFHESCMELAQVGKDIHVYSPRLNDDVIVFEGAQGLLIDQRLGFHPHTTWSDVTPRHAIDLAKAAHATEMHVLGITRTYMTRHGNGPFPTEDVDLRFEDRGNPEHPYQGRMRFGHLDRDWLRDVPLQHVPEMTGLVVNCLDQSPMPGWLEQIEKVQIVSTGPTWEHRREVA